MAKLIHTLPSQTTGAWINKVHTSNESRWLIVLIYFVAATVALAALSLLVRGAGQLPIDLAASHWVQSVHAGWYDVLLRAVGEPGYPPQVYVLVAWIVLVLFFTRLKWESAMEVFATVGIGVVGLAIKMLVDQRHYRVGWWETEFSRRARSVVYGSFRLSVVRQFGSLQEPMD